MVLFLDFDGVLHPMPGFNSSHAMFCNLPLLLDFLPRACELDPTFSIVISSSWRSELELADLCELFPEQYRHLIVGITPEHTYGMSYGGRLQEILEYVQAHNISDWLAIDDNEYIFGDCLDNVLLCNPETGITHFDIRILEYKLNQSQSADNQ